MPKEMVIALGIVAFIATCILISKIGFWGFLLVVLFLVLIAGIIYLWIQIEFLSEEMIELEENFTQKISYLNTETSNTRELINVSSV